jgi:RNA polymerase sigma-70 factor (ECF subfamily)
MAMDSSGAAPGLDAADPHAELAREAIAGDLSAMRRLLDLVAPRVLRVIKSVLGPGDPDAEDLAQESLIALVRALPAFRGECPARAYASRIAVRTALAGKRRRMARAARLRELPPDPEEAATAPAEHHSAEQRKALLRELLAELPEAQAEALALRVVLGCRLDEVARATGAPVNTVRSRLRLAKQALKRRIEADPELLSELEVNP